MVEKELIKLGFSNNEAKIYSTLFLLKKAKAGKIIKETGLHRSVVYLVLDDFLERNLISKVQTAQGAIFSPNDPKHLIAETQVKTKLARNIASKLELLQTKQPREIAVYEGAEGIIKSCNKNLEAEHADTTYFLGPSKFGVQAGLEDYWQTYHKRRIRKGIASKILYDRTTKDSIVINRNKLKNSEARYMPFGQEIPMWINVCGDMTAIIMPGDDPPLVVNIKSKSTADTFKKYFDIFWEQTEKK